MRKYIFFTCDGSTLDPDGNETENSQVLGWGEGSDEMSAFERFKSEHKFVKIYKKVSCQEIANEQIHRIYTA